MQASDLGFLAVRIVPDTVTILPFNPRLSGAIIRAFARYRAVVRSRFRPQLGMIVLDLAIPTTAHGALNVL
jgi:hypothetical protein